MSVEAERWRAAIKRSGLKSSPRLVAFLIADSWTDDAVVVPVVTPELVADSGLSRRPVQQAIGALVDGGWLVLVERERQHRSPRYAPTIPRGADSTPLGDSRGADFVVRGADSTPLGAVDNSRGADSARLESPRGADFVVRGADFASRGAESAPDGVTTKTNTTTTGTSPADELALVVVEALPEILGRSITRSVLQAACVPLAAAGWTPETLAQTVQDRPWGDVRAGGVIQWLRGLPAAPQPRTAPPRCPECVGGWLRDERGERSATRCPSCRPRAVAS